MLSEWLCEALHMLNIEAVYWFQSISGVDRALQVVALGIFQLPAERRVRGCDKLSLRARRPNNVGSLRCLATVGGLHGRASMRGLF